MGGLLGAIWGRHMGQEHVLRYQEAIQGGKLVVTVHGTRQDLDMARRILDETGGRNVSIYSAS